MPATDSGAGCALHRGALAAGPGGAKPTPSCVLGPGAAFDRMKGRLYLFSKVPSTC